MTTMNGQPEGKGENRVLVAAFWVTFAVICYGILISPTLF